MKKNLHNEMILKHGEYFPKKDIWIVFDMGNGHKETHQYVWYFRSKKLAIEFIREQLKNPYGYDVSYPTKWKIVVDVPD